MIRCGDQTPNAQVFLYLGFASRTIIWSLVKQMRMRLVPFFKWGMRIALLHKSV